MKRIVLLISTFLLVFGVANERLTAKPLTPMTTSCELLSRPAKGGNIRIKLNFHWRDSTITSVVNGLATITKVDNLVYDGPMEFPAVAGNNTKDYFLDVVVPPNDTSGIELRLTAIHVGWNFAAIYFVTTGDTLETYPGHPPSPDNYKMPMPKKRTGRVIPGEFPKEDSIYGIGDTAVKHEPSIITMQLTKSEILLEKKRRAEQHILTDKPKESFYIDGVMWQRNKGEQYFHKVEPILDTDAYMKHITDSLANLPNDHIFEICVNLSDSEQKSKVQEILGYLPKPIENNYYHIKIKKKDILKLVKAGIRFSYPN